jgi:DNA recombination protein RmuC
MTTTALLLLLMTGFAALLMVLVLVLGRSNRRLRDANVDLQKSNAGLEARLQGEQALALERTAALAQAEERLAATFSRLAGETLSRNSEQFLQLAEQNLGRQQEKARADLTEREKAVATLVKPIEEALERTRQQIADIEKNRQESFGSIRTQLARMSTDQQQLQQETRNLVSALRRPQVRGQWGELTLRRVAELAGMVEYCDFDEQETVTGEDSRSRPDMIIRLPDRGTIVVDVKTPLDAYLDAVEAKDEDARRTALQRHARHVMDRVRELSAKAYWAQFPTSPEFVILFIPGDQVLGAALDENPKLMEDALRNKVILATPTSLIALLKAIAYGWREVSLAENAEHVRRLAEELYERLLPFSDHLAKLGRALEGSVRAFNDAVGSMERKILPSARRMAELGIRTKARLPELQPVEHAVRTLSTPSPSPDDAAPVAPTSTEEIAPPADDAGRPH